MYGSFVWGNQFVISSLYPFHFGNHLNEEERDGCFTSIVFLLPFICLYMGLDARNPVLGDCEHQRHRPAQSGQSLCYLLNEKYHI